MPDTTARHSQNGLLEAVAERLIPLFLIPGHTAEHARGAALEAIAGYDPQSPADYASIARILAFTLAAVSVIGRAAEPDLPPNLQLRYLGKANTLSRSAEQAERGMAQRHRQANQPQAERPKTTPPRPEPKQTAPAQSAPPVTDDVILAQVESAMAEFQSLLPQSLSARPAPPPFAATPAAAAPRSFRAALRQQTPLGARHLGA